MELPSITECMGNDSIRFEIRNISGEMSGNVHILYLCLTLSEAKHINFLLDVNFEPLKNEIIISPDPTHRIN